MYDDTLEAYCIREHMVRENTGKLQQGEGGGGRGERKHKHALGQLRDALTKRVGEPGVATLFEIVEVDRVVDVVEAIEVAPADRHCLAAGFDRRCHS